MTTLYLNYFDKHKPFRHYAQHLLVMFIGITILTIAFKVSINLSQIIVFIIFSFIVDIDGIISLFTTAAKVPESRLIREALLKQNFIQAATLATTHHKRFNRLFLHNVIGLTIVITGFILSLISGNQTGLTVFTAVLSHFIFDIADDYFQLGHLNNWLWPIGKILKIQNRI